MTYGLRHQNRSIKKFNLLAFCLICTSSYAAVEQNIQFPLPPRLSIWGSSGTNTFGEGDVMIPIWGNPNQTFYGDISAKYGDDRAWFASAGLGVRKIVPNNIIVGGYFFTDYNKTPNANYFTVLNPGLEFMNNQWDAHLNGYVPVGQKSELMRIFTGNQLGMSNTTFFRGHAQYDALFDQIENVGTGFDLEVGHTFHTFSYLKRTRVFAGGYYFNPKFTSSVRGGAAGIEMPLTHTWASVEMRDSYDNINRNTFVLTLRFTLGGLDKTGEPDIHDRMLDRIPRHMGNLSNGDGIPSQKKILNTGRTTLVQDNIWFFNPDAPSAPFVVLAQPTTIESCTFEHPCLGLSQTRINQINVIAPKANFYLSSGTYNNPNLGLAFSFHNGQNVFGRTSNFNQLATGSDRPLLNDSLFLEGNNNIYNIRVDGHTIRNLETGGMLVPFQVGVLARSFSTGTINIYNSDMTSNATANNVIGFANNSNVALVNIYNSNMTSSVANLAGSISIGAGNLRTSNLNINNSSLFASNIDTTNNFNLAFGFVNNESGKVNISNSSISSTLVHGGLAVGLLNNSSLGLGKGTVTIIGSTLSVNADDAAIVGGVLNQANNPGGISADVKINESAISVTANNNGGSTAAGVLTSGTGTVSVNNTIIDGTANSGSISGIIVGNPTAVANYQNTTISLNTSGAAVGTPTQNGGTLNDNGGNQCFENGIAVPCQ